jgi:hypothetical protein
MVPLHLMEHIMAFNLYQTGQDRPRQDKTRQEGVPMAEEADCSARDEGQFGTLQDKTRQHNTRI